MANPTQPPIDVRPALAAITALSRVALDADPWLDELERVYLGSEAEYLTLAACLFARVLDRIQQLRHESVERLDDTPRLERLREAA